MLPAGPNPAGLRSALAVRQGRDRPRAHDRHRRLVRLADDQERPGGIRPGLRPAGAAEIHDHPSRGQGARLQPEQFQHGRLGRRDHAGRGVRARDRPGRQHPAGRDAGLGDRGRARLPADHQGRGVRGPEPPRRRDQPELQRHRADLPRQGRGPGAARRLPARRQEPRHRAGRLGRLGRRRRQARREHVLPVPGDLVAGQRPAGDRGRRHPAARHRDRASPPRRRSGTTPTTGPRTSSPSATRARTRWPAAAAARSCSAGPDTRTG